MYVFNLIAQYSFRQRKYDIQTFSYLEIVRPVTLPCFHKLRATKLIYHFLLTNEISNSNLSCNSIQSKYRKIFNEKQNEKLHFFNFE